MSGPQTNHIKVVSTVFHRLTRVLGNPDTTDPQGYVDEFVLALGDYTEDELNRGVDLLLKRLRYHKWPTIGELDKSIRDAREFRAGTATSSRSARDLSQVESRVNNFVSGGQDCLWRWDQNFRTLPLVDQAEREGWGRELRSYVRRRVRTALASGRDLGDPQSFLPSESTVTEYPVTGPDGHPVTLIETWRRAAAGERDARAWQIANPHDKALKGRGGKGGSILSDVRRRMDARASEGRP